MENSMNNNTNIIKSFRQVGTKPYKKPQNKHKNQVHSEKTVHSIPSKYETIVHIGNRELNAFGNRTYRFEDSENELPGPGSYYKPTTFVRTTEISGSVNKLGYGSGFISKSDRFMYDNNGNGIPGPGNYQTKSFLESQNYKKNNGMSCFQTSREELSQKPKLDVPGPGQYNVNINNKSSTTAAAAAFRSSTNRLDMTNNGKIKHQNILPGPGHYDHPIQIKTNKSKGYNASFKSNVKRINDNNSNITPGPGSYAVEIAEKYKHIDTVGRARPSSMFSRSSTSIIQKQLNQESTPGPGYYNYETEKIEKKQTISGAVSSFKSNTFRVLSDLNHSTIPGPAFYKPSEPIKKSYLLNGNKKWL